MSRLSSLESDFSDDHSPSPFQKSDTPIIIAAIGHFSKLESHLYYFILAILQNARLDESVTIGTVVLLDLLADLYKMGQIKEGNKSRLVLPPYPHQDHLSYFLGAFMLAHRLLSRDGPRNEVFWKNVMGLHEVKKLENDLRDMLEDNINYYPPPQIPPDDPAYQFYYAGDILIRPNAFIPRLRYFKTKATMYAHIRVRMTSRGEPPANYPHTTRSNLTWYLPPCHDYMIDKMVCLAEARRVFPK